MRMIDYVKAEGIEQGVLIGMEKGIKQRTEFIVSNMVRNNLKKKDISQMTGVSIEEIDRILQKKN